MNSPSSLPPSGSGERWRFLRDVMVFQLKLLLDNLRDFALVPISLVAALIDLVYKGKREGALFYKVLRWGAHSEEVIDVYSAIEHHPPGDFKVNPAYTVDAVIARLEGVLVREYEKGGTAASIKAAMDRAIDQLHHETRDKGDRARDLVARAADRLRLKIDTLPAETGEGITPEERSRLESIEAVLRSENVREQIRRVVERVRAELARKKEALMTWEPIPLTVFGGALLPEIRSAWVFVLRAGADTGAERHPNSHQRMMSFEGSGDLQTGEPGRWQSNVLISNPDVPLEQRWVSIPRNVWHRPVVGEDADWAVVSFHTVVADELIEERPDSNSRDGTKQVKYLARN